MHHLRVILALSKVRIAILSTLSAVCGYMLALPGVSWGLVLPSLGVFVLACGAAALNQWQERDIDPLMERTKTRPLPTGQVTPTYALVVSLVMIALGLWLLWPNVTAVLLGALTVVWYNGIYTPLKRISAFAAIPGGVVGALPPVIGWAAAGGNVSDPRVLAVAFFFFVWQIPHFWLLLMRIGPQYEAAGLPTLTQLLSKRQLTRVTYVWMLATGFSVVMMPLFGVGGGWWLPLGLVLSTLWLGWHATMMVRSNGEVVAFKEINMYALVVIMLLALSGLLA